MVKIVENYGGNGYMINWFRMKKQEIQFKLLFYSYANVMILRKSDLVHIGLGLLESCKDKSPDEIKKEFIQTIAETANKNNTVNLLKEKDAEIEDLKVHVETLSKAYDKLSAEKKNG